MQLPLRIDNSRRQPLQGQVFDQLRHLILDGRMKPGAPVPATRLLARQLGVSRNTVMLAYERLIAEGFLQTRPAVGTFVSVDLPVVRPTTGFDGRVRVGDVQDRHASRHPLAFRGRRHQIWKERDAALDVDFRIDRPDPHSFPAKTWKRLLGRRVATAGSSMVDYGDPGGLMVLRKAIVDFLGPARGIRARPEQVIIVGGRQEGLSVVGRMLVRPGARVVMECPTYQGSLNLFESIGARLMAVPVDAEGLEVARLPAEPAALVHVTPSHQYPLGVTLSLERRLRLLDWAWESGAYVLEDDHASAFHYQGSPLTSLKGLDRRGSVLYMGTFSKTLGAGLRIGYLVVPRELVEPATTVKALQDNGHPWLDQAALADFITSGGYVNHLRRMRQVYVTRRDALVAALRRHFGPQEVSGMAGGMHLAWHLPSGFPDVETMEKLARDRGVGVYSMRSGSSCECGHRHFGGRMLLLGYSSLTEAAIAEGVARLAAAVTEWRGKGGFASAPTNLRVANHAFPS